MNKQKDFIEIILGQKEGKEREQWNGKMIDYLLKVSENPEIANFAPGRIFNMIMKYGVEPVEESLKTKGYEDLVKYNFFKNKIYGTLEPIHDLMRFLKASARRTETGKRILIMIGPVASGKSTIASLIKKGLELDDTPKFTIKGCQMHEEPLHLIPHIDRPFWEEKLGVKIEGSLCPTCQRMVDTDYTNKEGVVNWEDVIVESFTFSEQRRKGIGTFQPSDPKSQDITELIGRINMGKSARYGETDARAYQFDGEMQIANGGIMEYIEILKADIKFLYVLISAAQEQVIKSPGFPQIHIDEVILSHTNQSEFDKFKSNRDNEAIHDRMYSVMVPYNLKIDDEIKIYEKMIRESDFRDIHIAPYTLKMAAEFAILSRLIPTPRLSSIVEKMKLYNGETTEGFRKQEIDIRSLIEEGKAKGEGMTGISPRFVINALNVALAMKEDKNCINPIDIIRALKQNFEHHIGISEEDKSRYISYLDGDKDSVAKEFKDIAKKEVNMAFLYAYEDQAQALFKRYMVNVESFCQKKDIQDSITGEYSKPDETLMRSIEELIGVPENSKGIFRSEVLIHENSVIKSGRIFDYKSYDPIKEAIERKLMKDLKNVVSLSIADSTSTDPKSEKKRTKAFETLMERGYCKTCANVLLALVGEILRRE